MSLQYLSDEKGQIIAVQVPIKEWEILIGKYPEFETANMILPEWQMALIDKRLAAIKENPNRILPIDSLIAELDHSDD